MIGNFKMIGILNFLAVYISLISSGTAGEESMDPAEFSKLSLNLNALKGSRWALEQSNFIKVFHAIEIVDLTTVDVDGMRIRVEFYVRQRWEANKLELPNGLFTDSDNTSQFISAEEDVLKSVWSPDSFIPNAQDLKIHSLNAQNSVVNIYKNKTIIFKARMYAVLGCSFTFEWYPLDVQVCDLVLESYKYAYSLVRYDWEARKNPVTINKNIILYQYDIFTPLKISKGENQRWGGDCSYPFVKITFRFERKLGNNIIQVFTPTILITILSFFSFWLGLDAVPGRISLLVTCILTIVTMHSGLKGSVPTVHYIKMMDIWMIGCMCFIFGAICEFIVVKYMKWRTQQIQAAKEAQEKYAKSSGAQKSYPMKIPAMNSMHLHNMHHSNMMSLPNTIPGDLNQQHPYILQYLKNAEEAGGRIPPPSMAHSQKRQAWERGFQAAAAAAHGMPPPYPGEYAPAFAHMHEVTLYDRGMVPPPPSTPLWVQIDRVCRILFPLLFCAFNGAFWPILLLGSAKQHRDAITK